MHKFLTASYSANQKKLLRLIWNAKDTTRQYLSREAELSSLTVNKIVASFIADGVVVEDRTIDAKFGRKPTVLEINPNYGFIIGVDIGAYRVGIGLLSLTGEIVEKIEVIYRAREFPATVLSTDELIERIGAVHEKYRERNILGIGLGISGLVNHSDGRIVYCPNIVGYDNFAIKEFLEKRFGLPVFVNTSARCMALAEQRLGAGAGVQNQIFVSLGYGSIAAGIIVNGELFYGAGGFSGEIGHLTSPSRRGVQCTCGNYDCLETQATLPAIVAHIAKELEQPNIFSIANTLVSQPSDINVDIINQALDGGDKIVYCLLDEIGSSIGDTLTCLVNILNPEVMILGGGSILCLPMLMEPIMRTLKQKALITNQRILKVRESTLGPDCGLIGSAMQVINEFFR